MSQRLDVPFNIFIMNLTPAQLARMSPVTSLDVYSGSTKNFHPEGLFSTEIFGVTGTEIRKKRWGFIDLRVQIIHPTLYKALMQVRSFYGAIMERKEFAVWNAETEDFDRSTVMEGRTGFEFFCEYLPRIKFPNNNTETRQQAVALLEKWRDKMLIKDFLVMPAGYREFEIDENGRESVNEINEYYARLIRISNTINRTTLRTSPEAYDMPRMSMQRAVLELYDHLSQMIEGKKNLLMGKFAGRKVNNGTRNVLTSMTSVARELGHPRNVGMNDMLLGLYQFSKSVQPITIERLRNGFLSTVFTVPGAPARLCNRETLQSERVPLRADAYAQWLSVEGLEKQLTYYKEESIRHSPVRIEDHYLGLVYRGPDGTFAFIHGIEELPEGRQPADCQPITLTDLLYHALYTEASKYYTFMTRYPITGMGSTFPARVYLKSTVKSEERVELDPLTWEPMEGRVAYDFPVIDSAFFNSQSPHPSRLSGLTADFDGDTGSATTVYSVEARAEIEDFLKKKKAYVGADGEFIYDTETDTIKFVLANITGDPIATA